jgi:hypothetical protein
MPMGILLSYDAAPTEGCGLTGKGQKVNYDKYINAAIPAADDSGAVALS